MGGSSVGYLKETEDLNMGQPCASNHSATLPVMASAQSC